MTVKNGSVDRVAMIDFLDAQTWTRIGDRAARARRKRAAIAYVTEDQPLALEKGDILVTNASDQAVASGGTSPSVLRKLFARGVSLYSFPALHAKVVVLDSAVFVSSANLSIHSQHHLYEAGIETDNPNVRSQAIAFIQSAASHSVPITEDFLDRIEQIPIAKRSYVDLPDRYTNQSSEAFRARTWLVGVHGLKEPTDSEEIRLVNEGTRLATEFLTNSDSSPVYIRFGRTERISKVAANGDNLILIWRTAAGGYPERVYYHARVLVNQEGPRHNLIFYEQLPQAEEESLTWKQFQKLLGKLGIPKVSKDSTRELTIEQSNKIHELWESARL